MRPQCFSQTHDDLIFMEIAFLNQYDYDQQFADLQVCAKIE